MTIQNMTGVNEVKTGINVPGLLSSNHEVIVKTLSTLGLIKASAETVEKVQSLAAAGAPLKSMIHSFTISEVDQALAKTNAPLEHRLQFKVKLEREGLLQNRFY